MCSIFIIFIATPNCTTKPMYIALESKKEVVISLECSGVPTPTYQWFKNGIKVPGQVSSSYIEYINDKSIQTPLASTSGTYSCELRNMAGSYNWMEATIG